LMLTHGTLAKTGGRESKSKVAGGDKGGKKNGLPGGGGVRSWARGNITGAQRHRKKESH